MLIRLPCTGESYAGKYVPSFAYAIHLHNKKMRRGELSVTHLVFYFIDKTY